MKEKFRLLKEHAYFKCKFSLIMFFVSIILNLGMWVMLFLSVKPAKFPIPLHYSVYFGIDAVDLWYKVFLVPLVGVILIFLNLTFCLFFHKKEKFLSYFLSANNVFLQLALLGAGIPIVLLQSSL